MKGFFKFYAGETGEEWRGNRFSWKEGAVSPLEGGFARRLEEGMEGVEKVLGSGFGGVWIRKVGSEAEKGGLDWCLAEEGKGREGGQESQQLAKWVHADLVVRDPFEWHKVSVLNLFVSFLPREEQEEGKVKRRDALEFFFTQPDDPPVLPFVPSSLPSPELHPTDHPGDLSTDP